MPPGARSIRDRGRRGLGWWASAGSAARRGRGARGTRKLPQVPDGLARAPAVALRQVVDDVAVGTAAEATVILSAGADLERRRLLAVERAAAPVFVGAAPLQLDVAAHGLDQIDLAALPGRVVVYAYPRTGQPGIASPDGWDRIPGAQGCTPQSCAFRDHFAEL